MQRKNKYFVDLSKKQIYKKSAKFNTEKNGESFYNQKINGLFHRLIVKTYKKSKFLLNDQY